MIWYFITFAITFFISFMYILDTHTILLTNMNNKYQKWKKLNSLIATTHTNKCKIVWYSLMMIMQTILISFKQYLNNNVKKLNKSTFEITYVIKGQIYKIIISLPSMSGPSPILQISDENQNDLTDIVLPYMGPLYDWHGNHFTPEFFNCKSLTFELSNGTEHTYEDKITKLPK